MDGTGLLTKPLLFVSSYSPLFVLLAIRFDEIAIQVACIMLAALGSIIVPLIFGIHRKTTTAAAMTFANVQPAGGESSAYLAGYLLPFVTVAQPGLRDLLTYVVFLLIAGIIHCRTSAIQVNPTLLLLGWRVLRVDDDRGFVGYLITRRRVVKGDTVQTVRLSDDVLIGKPTQYNDAGRLSS